MPAMQTGRQAPPPPPHTPLPEDFQDIRGSPGRHMNGMNGQPSDDLLKAQKAQMKAELDDQLKQLDGERKEGLYRLDWELAEAIEALHARHAERANKMISQHKQSISQMEKRAQAGEPMTPEKARSPMQARSPTQVPVGHSPGQSRNALGHVPRSQSSYSQVSEESVEESEEESEEEGVFSTINNLLGMVRDEFLPEEAVHSRRPQMGQPMYPQHYMNGHAPAPHMNGHTNGHGPPMDHLSNGHLQRQACSDGDPGSPGRRNSFGSPMALPFDQSLVPSQDSMPPLVPFANGQGNYDAQSPSTNGLAPLTSDWSPAAVGLSPDLGFSSGLVNSFGPVSPQPGSMRPNWPPANVYHGGGYA